MNGLTLDELAAIIGYKELELYEVRKELARTRAVLAEVTSSAANEGTNEGSASAEDDTAKNPES